MQESSADLRRARLSRRSFMAASGATTAATAFNLFGGWGSALAAPLAAGLADPALQPLFTEQAPNALADHFKFRGYRGRNSDLYYVSMRQARHWSGLRNAAGSKVSTEIYGYGDFWGSTWPGKTIEVRKDRPARVRWSNQLPFGREHLLPHDDTMHWGYALHGYEGKTIKRHGVPTVVHVHGGHTEPESDGYPEAFFSPWNRVRGPEWEKRDYHYANDQQAGALWYHDHSLGMTRLNVYAGLAGFYIVRDDQDTGRGDNPLGLPAGDHELGYVIQDRMFRDNGELFYPAFPGDPAWFDFITDQGLADDQVPQPSALAEFFGDVITVNGKIWPKTDVTGRHYRVRLLNGSDSRFYALQLRAVAPGATTLDGASAPLPFWVVGSDQGLGTARQMDHVLLMPGERLDVVIDFSGHEGRRLILSNTAGDAPFGGDLVAEPDDLFPNRFTDRIMAFDVQGGGSSISGRRRGGDDDTDRFDPANLPTYAGVRGPVDHVRKVALFEGKDEFGRLQPMLGTGIPTADETGESRNGTLPWHAPITELPKLGSTEIWEIFNVTEDAHPVHLHQVNFQILGRRPIDADVVPQPVTQHNGTTGQGFRLENIRIHQDQRIDSPNFYETSPKDMVVALPGQVTRIKMTWDIEGLYVWHCHILSHEDHDMMRPLRVVR